MLRGTIINLRALEPQDVEMLFQWENDEANWHLSNTVAPYSKFVLEQYVLSSEQDIYASKQLRLIIEVVKDGANIPIGSIDLFDFEPAHKRAGIGILILQEYRNKGFASESLEMLIDYGFNTLHLHQLYCNITVDNIASIKVFEKQNFKTIGLKKDWLLVKGKWVDEYILQLINK